jgi:sarcosine oxidase
MITRTPDKQFLLGRVGGDPRLIVGGGCSGHGFKHAAGIGEVLADLAQDRDPAIDLSFCAPDRFR